MITAPHSRRHKVALLGVEMEAIRRKSKQWLLNIPGHLAPASAAQSMDMVRPSRNGDADVAAFVARRRCCAVLAGNNVDERVWRKGVTDSEYDSYREFVKNDPDCRYCAVTNAFNRVRTDPTATSSYKKVGGAHKGTMIPHFDPETFVTEVTVTGHEIECSWDIAEKLLDAADPRNWKKYGGDFFLNSDPGRWERGRWYPGAWQSQHGGDLLEVTQFDVNEDVTAEVHNILSISNFEPKERSISYDYSLRHCLKSNLGLAWEYGGLDLDGGRYTATVIDNQKGGARVAIGASKSVRYTRPRNNPAIGTLYNLLAPATISLLMRHLVYESVDRLKTPQTAGQSPTANETARTK